MNKTSFKFLIRLWIAGLVGLLAPDARAQTDSRNLPDLLENNYKIIVYDPQTVNVSHPVADVPNEDVARLFESRADNWSRNSIEASSGTLYLELKTDEDVLHTNTGTIVKLKVNADCWNKDGTKTEYRDIELHAAYNNEPGTPYVFQHSWSAANTFYARVTVTQLIYVREEGEDHVNFYPETGSVENELARERVRGNSSLVTPFTLTASIETGPTYSILPSGPTIAGNLNDYRSVPLTTVDEQTGDLKVIWRGVPAAAAYTELQWTFVNTYNNINPTYDFRNNSTTVQIPAGGNDNQSYRIPLVFEEGWLIFRIRWVYLTGADKKPVYSTWSLAESGPAGLFAREVALGEGARLRISGSLIHEGDRRNWQYIAAYAEEGKHKDVVTYYDGTMRSRQAVTRLSTDTTVIVGETIYDFNGRPAIQVQPAPLSQKEAATGKFPIQLKYYPGFTISQSTGKPYSYKDFDLGGLCEASHAAPMHSEWGAARYYSDQNEDKSRFNAHIPRAGGYPFIQTEYTPDNTGRIRRQGGVGDTFQLRKGHDTRFYYGSPSQDELDRLFGNDAGDASFYKKNMVTDPNGQTAVQYLDMKGNVIASGLAGDGPDNVDKLDNQLSFTHTKNLLPREQDRSGNTLASSSTLLVEEDETNVTFEYTLTPGILEKDVCGSDWCLGCQYDYQIQVVDECGTSLWSKTAPGVGFSTFATGCPPSEVPAPTGEDFSLVLNKGSYTVSRTLTVTQRSVEAYASLYDNGLPCPVVPPPYGSFPELGCDVTCENCSEKTYARFSRPGTHTLTDEGGNSYQVYVSQSDIDRANAHCQNLCKTDASSLDNIMRLMLSDVSVNGIYGKVVKSEQDEEGADILLTLEQHPELFPLSVFNEDNRLGAGRRNYRYPAKSRFNPGMGYYEKKPDGSFVESWILIPVEKEHLYSAMTGAEAEPIVKYKYEEGRLWVKPQYLNDLVDFERAWKNGWAYALLPYHPEYPVLLWHLKDQASYNYDDELLRMVHYSDAQRRGITSVNVAEPAILARDPYFSSHPEAKAWIKTQLFTGTSRNTIVRTALHNNYCGFEGIGEAELNACIAARSLYEPGNEDTDWQTVRMLYLQKKKEWQDAQRQRPGEVPWTLTGSEFENLETSTITYQRNLVIGESEGCTPDYCDKQPRMPTTNDIIRLTSDCSTGPEGEITPEVVECIAGKAKRRAKQDCNRCPIAGDVEGLLNILTRTGNLTTATARPLPNGHIPSAGLLAAMGSSAIRRVNYTAAFTLSDNGLILTFRAQEGFSGTPAREYEHYIRLMHYEAGLNWSNVRFIRCLTHIIHPEKFPYAAGKNFTVRVLDDRGVEHRVEGTSSCFVLNDCNNSRECIPTPDAAGLFYLAKELFGKSSTDPRNALATTPFSLYDERHARPEYITEAITRFRTGGSTNEWLWQKADGGDLSFKGRLTARCSGAGCTNIGDRSCDILFTLSGQGRSFAQIPFEIVSLTPVKDDRTPECKIRKFRLKARKGTDIFYIDGEVLGDCFIISECCHSDPVAACPNPVRGGNFEFTVYPPVTSNLGWGRLNNSNTGPWIALQIGTRSIGNFGILNPGNTLRLFKPVDLPVKRTIQTGGLGIPRSNKPEKPKQTEKAFLPLVIWEQLFLSEPNSNLTLRFLCKVFEDAASKPLRYLKLQANTGTGWTDVPLTGTDVANDFVLFKGDLNIEAGGELGLRIVYDGPEMPDVLAGIDDIVLVTNKCMPCCPRWITPPPPPAKDCESNRDNLLVFYQGEREREVIAQQRNEIRNEYVNACLENADAFSALLETKIYQLTLFYYDQAGNLVKTIPPAGVKPLTDLSDVKRHRNGETRTPLFPGHTMASTYTYNTLNEVTKKESPDAGITEMYYDELGRVHLSQDAEQRATTFLSNFKQHFNYLLYDEMGRIKESGVVALKQDEAKAKAGKHHDLSVLIAAAGATNKKEVTRIFYDEFASAGVNAYFGPGGQQMLRNRVAGTVFAEDGDTENYNTASWYSYDYHGNAKTVIQENREDVLSRLGQSRKRIDYEYDLVSGKTNRVWYQRGKADQYIHRYFYDADNRITEVYSGTNERYLQRDAAYEYYRHGPLARIELGDCRVQGIDYAYTLQGWLKAINSNKAGPDADMGTDGYRESRVAPDLYGFSLHYFAGDYSPIAPRDAAERRILAANDPLTSAQSLYNGNIAATATTLNGITDPKSLLSRYRYDQLHRLTESNTFNTYTAKTNEWAGTGTNPLYKTAYSYDPNGNIKNLQRFYDGKKFDDLQYEPFSSPAAYADNRLMSLKDAAGTHTGAGDLSGTTDYEYFANGNLKKNGSVNLAWTASGRIKKYGDAHQYHYDAAQRRIKKTDLAAGDAMYYVYDAAGNTLALYRYTGGELHWLGSPVYGAGRLGMYRAGTKMSATETAPPDTLLRGQTHYELSNHLGDVLVTLSDKKIYAPVPGGGIEARADRLSTQEYLPFGMPMPNRALQLDHENPHPYGYNGMEQDKKAGADGYTTEFRQYDPRIARWVSIDPVIKPSESPYLSFNNAPTLFSDIKGDDPDEDCSQPILTEQTETTMVFSCRSEVPEDAVVQPHSANDDFTNVVIGSLLSQLRSDGLRWVRELADARNFYNREHGFLKTLFENHQISEAYYSLRRLELQSEVREITAANPLSRLVNIYKTPEEQMVRFYSVVLEARSVTPRTNAWFNALNQITPWVVSAINLGLDIQTLNNMINDPSPDVVIPGIISLAGSAAGYAADLGVGGTTVTTVRGVAGPAGIFATVLLTPARAGEMDDRWRTRLLMDRLMQQRRERVARDRRLENEMRSNSFFRP